MDSPLSGILGYFLHTSLPQVGSTLCVFPWVVDITL